MKFFKFIFGIVLLPSCVAVTVGLVGILRLLQPEQVSHVPTSVWGFLAGFVIWAVLYLCMPRPTRTYVLGHELSHLLWAWLLGIEAGGLRVTSAGGSVRVSRNHFLVTLAPYFFPIYTLLVICIRFVVNMFYDTASYEPLWLGLIGLTWSFHLTFTLSMLKQQQPDIQQEGYLFSYVIIYLFSIAGVGLWIVLASSIPIQFFIEQTTAGHMMVFDWEYGLFARLIEWVKALSNR